ncbi:hypothetical protein Tco_0110837 [Tanacetum coccineum]
MTVYPPNTSARLVPRVLPTKSQVKINIYTLIQLFSDFDKTCKKRITPTGLTEGERGFEQTKECYLTEVIPFFKTIKEHFEEIQKALIKEVKEMKEIFEQMEAEVDQNVVDKKSAEIERKNLLIINENLIADCLSNELFYSVINYENTVSRFSEMHVAYTVERARIVEHEAEISKLKYNIQKDDHSLRMADSHTGNHPKDDFTPLETIRRSYSVIREKIPFELEGETFEPERGSNIKCPSTGVVCIKCHSPLYEEAILPKKSETIYDAPLGFAGLYTHHFSLFNLRLPIPLFICDMLNYFKAYDGEPFVDLLRSFLNLGRVGDWLTLSNRGGANGTEIDFRSFMILGVDGEFNLLPEGGFDDNQGSFSVKSVNNKTPIIDAEPISAVLPANVANNIIDSNNTSFDDELPPVHPLTSFLLGVGKKSKAARKRKLSVDALREGSHRRAPAQASKVVGDASTPLDVDNDPDIHGKFEPVYGVVAHVTIPSWKQHLKDISIEHLCNIYDRAYMRQAILDNINKLVHSDEMGVLVAKLVRLAIIYGICMAFEEVAKLKEPFVLEKMPNYRTSLKDEYDQAGEDMANASYPFLSEFTSNPYAFMEQLLSMKPRLL